MLPSENYVLNAITISLRGRDAGLQGNTRQSVSKQNFKIWNKKNVMLKIVTNITVL
jgi:hypothetical protein